MTNILDAILHIFHPDKMDREHTFIKVASIEFETEYYGFVNAEYSVICPVCKKYETIERSFSFDTAKHLKLIDEIKSYPQSDRLDWLKGRGLNSVITEAENFKGDKFISQSEVMK